MTDKIDPDLLKLLRCPTSGLPLRVEGNGLVSADNAQRYKVISGIPCLIPASPRPTHEGYVKILEANRRFNEGSVVVDDAYVANFVQAMLVATCGNLFQGVTLRDKLPIPDLSDAFPSGRVLDVGCNWGRWTIAGSKAGYRMIGLDIHLDSLLCARRLAQRMTPSNPPLFVLGDARQMPFAPECFQGVFSYSVVQHFSKPNAGKILAEIGRVLERGGKALVQLPNRGGFRSKLVLARRMFSEGTEFDVRYYSISEALGLCADAIGESGWHVDCFCGLNVHSRDRDLVPDSRKWVVDVADFLRRSSDKVPLLGRLSDSIFISSIKN